MRVVLRVVVDIMGFLVVFALLQIMAMKTVSLFILLYSGMAFQCALQHAFQTSVLSSNGIILSSGLSGVLTILLFVWRKWANVSTSFLSCKSVIPICWIILLALGTLFPSTWMVEQMQVDVPTNIEQVLTMLLSSSWGYLVVGILTPIAEELIFRGAILRILLQSFRYQRVWIWIVLSAFIFALAHGNMAQLPHAFLMGLLLGWMYVRTNSVFPGIIFHWANNSLVFLLYQINSDLSHQRVIEMVGGSKAILYAVMLLSLIIVLISLYQLSLCLQKTTKSV